MVFSKFFTNFIFLKQMPWDSYGSTESTYLPSARNEIHRGYVEDMDAPYLMMLDSDVLPPPNLIETLLSHDKALVGGWYRNKRKPKPPHPIVYDFVEEDAGGLQFRHREEAGEGLEKVDGMGAGCWLMRRDLAEALGPKPYSMHKATEDLVLCRKITELGYDIWVDWNMACAHISVDYV
jgi:GT2 family glycosyltransferase